MGDNITALTNNTVRIKCPVSGVPKPKLNWALDGKEITSVGRYSIDDSGTLSVSKLDRKESGKFSCHARTKFGEESRTTKVDVVGK